MAGHSYLKSMVGKEFKVNRGGHDAVWGKLIDVKSDFLVLDTGEGNGICYFNLKHIKSFNEVIGGQNGNNGNSKVTYSSSPDYVHASKFSEVLEKLRPNVVTINRGGPEKIEGVLTDANEDYMIVVVNKDIIRIPTYHVKSISLYTGNNDKNDGNSNNNKNDKNDKSGKNDKNDKNKNKSGGKNDKSGKNHRSNTKDRDRSSRSGRSTVRSERRGRTRASYGGRKQARTRMAAKSTSRVRAKARAK